MGEVFDMTDKYCFLDARKRDCEVVVLTYSSGDRLLIIGENVGQDDEKAVMITVNNGQWNHLKDVISDDEAIKKIAVGL